MEKREELADFIEQNIKKFSGENLIFVVLLQIGLITIKMVVWRPKNYTLIAHNYRAPVHEGAEIFHVTSNHASCWRYDGFSFLNQFHQEKLFDFRVISCELLKDRKCFLDESKKLFVIKN